MPRIRTRIQVTFLIFILLAQSLLAQQVTSAPTVKLPVHRVVLYKNGVGYFEHRGKVIGNQQVDIDFTTAQLNDVLKSITVVDLGGGHISGVNYNSVAPLEERLRNLRLPLGAVTTREEFLNALRGTRVEVKNAANSVVGKLLSVETHQRLIDGKETEKLFEVTVITEEGEMRTFLLDPSTSIKVVERDLNNEVGHYMELIASTHAKDLRRMTVSSSGVGERGIFVSYISEVPVWKSTYRILLPEKTGDKPHLQGWAIVDNTVGEDWKDVELSLVAGAPQSFVQDLSQPLYIRRPVVELPKTAQLTPQTHEGAMIQNFVANGFDIRTKDKKEQQLNGRIANNQAVEVTSAAAQLEILTNNFPAASPAPYQISSDSEPVALAQEMGDLFEYRLKEPVTINKNQSAIVPILSSSVDAEKVTLWHEGARYPLRSLWMRNTTGQTLDSGAFNVVDSGAFAGEGIMEIFKPSERRLLSYAVEQGIRISTQFDSKRDNVTRVYAQQGTIFANRMLHEQKTYNVKNDDEVARTVVIEHPHRAGWNLDKTSVPEETTVNSHRFKFEAAPKKVTHYVVNETLDSYDQIQISSLTDDSITHYLKEKVFPYSLEKPLRFIMQQKHVVEDLREKINNKTNELSNIERDQQRVRENMKALKGSAEERILTVRYAKQFNEQEDRLDLLRKEAQSLNKQLTAEQGKLNSMFFEFKFDEKM